MKKIIFFVIFVYFNTNLFSESIEKRIEYQALKLKYILETAYKNHLDTFNIEEACENAFRSLLTSLDKQSAYFSAKQLRDYQEKNTGRAEGVGFTIVPINDTALIASVQANSPAEKAGIKKGDKLLFVDNQAVSGKTQQEIQDLLAGDTATYVNLIIKTSSNELKNLIIKREIFHVSSIASSFYLAKQKIAYITSSRFTTNVYEDLTAEIDKYLKRGLEYLIIDLRGNPGGYLDQVVKVTAEFLPKNSKIVYTNSRNPEFTMDITTDKDGKYIKLPLIVLVDGQTASAAEIFSAALQDNDRAIIIGENTFGKGTLQRLWTMNDGSGFRLTVGEYYSPSGRRIDKEIIQKNIEKIKLDESLKLSLGEQAYSELLKSFEETGGAARLPVYKTSKGRTIISKGGVLPDEIIKSDTLTLLSRVLMSRGILLEFTYNYSFMNSDKFTKEFNNFENFLINFNVDDNLYNDFVKFSLSKNIWNVDMAKIDEKIIRNLIKSYIALWKWDNFGYLAARNFEDKVFLLALSKLNNAKSLIN